MTRRVDRTDPHRRLRVRSALAAVVVLLENKIGELGNLLARITSVEWFNTLGESVTMVTGLIFVICVLAFRRGVMGEVIAWLDRRKGAKPAP